MPYLAGMKTMLLILLWLAAGQGPEEPLRVMFWNLENFFDWRDDGGSDAEAEFSSRGQRRWTRKRFYRKCNAIAKAVFWIAGETGGLPDVIALAEVENSFVLKRLLRATLLEKTDYRMVHFDSPDPRGIDVALLYRPSRLELIDSKPCHIFLLDGQVLPTRDILLAQFLETDGKSVAILVNHHPSKFGGTAVSEPRRRAAVECLGFLADSLRRMGERRIIACGDFNDTPDNPLYETLDSTLVNLSLPLWREGIGTIRYQGRWELIDQFFVSPEIAAGEARMRVLRIPFLMVRDNVHAGEKPLRTYVGPRYQGGVSDHLPIFLELFP